MQPFTAEFAEASLTPHAEPMKIGDATYRRMLDGTQAFVEERGPKGVRKLPIQHVMGGKNTYYFLTPLERGRLQVLPLAYDIQKKAWYDMAASGVRMHAGQAPRSPPRPGPTPPSPSTPPAIAATSASSDQLRPGQRTPTTPPGANPASIAKPAMATATRTSHSTRRT